MLSAVYSRFRRSALISRNALHRPPSAVTHAPADSGSSSRCAIQVVSENEKIRMVLAHTRAVHHGHPSSNSFDPQAVSFMLSDRITQHGMAPQWEELFDITSCTAEMRSWLWQLHAVMVERRFEDAGLSKGKLKRLCCALQRRIEEGEAALNSRSGSASPSKRRFPREDVSAVVNEALDSVVHRDLALLAALLQSCPLPRPDDVPLYAYYSLVHYIRFHVGLFSCLSNEEVLSGRFHFLLPDERAIFEEYGSVQLDQVGLQWKADIKQEVLT